MVEGEKTCEAARLLFPDYVVVTWNGGCGSVQKSDWSVLKGRDVTVWPDHDQAGLKAASTIAEILKDAKIVDFPSTLPHKWDLADTLPEGILDLLKEARPLHQDNLKVRIDQITHEYRFDRSFGALEEHHYQDIHKVFEALKKENSSLQETEILKQATFIVHHLKTYATFSHHEEDRAPISFVASKLFLEHPKRDASYHADLYFRASGIVRIPTYEMPHKSLRTTLQSLHQSYKQQQHLQQQSIKSLDKELFR